MGLLQDGATGDGKNSSATDNPSSNEIFENRPSPKKIIRVITVMAYLFSVSFVAIALSGYYVFLWQPPNSRLIPRARTMSQAQAQYLAENSPIEINSNNNKTNITEIFNRMNNIINGKNISSDKSLRINEGKSEVTNLLVNPISAQMHRNKSDKVTPVTSVDVYGILNGRIDASVKTKNLEALFTKMPNTTETLATTDGQHSTERAIKREEFNSTDRLTFSNDCDEVSKADGDPLAVGQKPHGNNHIEATQSTVDSVTMPFTEPIELSNTRGEEVIENVFR